MYISLLQDSRYTKKVIPPNLACAHKSDGVAYRSMGEGYLVEAC